MFNYDDYKVYLACGHTDMRKNINGLCEIVQNSFELDPTEKIMFAFCNRVHNRIKILVWEDNGFWVHFKRIESRRLEVTADKAVQSPEALIAYFSDTSSGRWIINRYSQMSKQERISFLKHVCNVLPYVASKNPFSDYLKELIKSNKLELIDLNCLIHDITSDSTKHLLTSDGYQLIFEKHKEKLDELMTKKNFLTKE